MLTVMLTDDDDTYLGVMVSGLFHDMRRRAKPDSYVCEVSVVWEYRSEGMGYSGAFKHMMRMRQRFPHCCLADPMQTFAMWSV